MTKFDEVRGSLTKLNRIQDELFRALMSMGDAYNKSETVKMAELGNASLELVCQMRGILFDLRPFYQPTEKKD